MFVYNITIKVDTNIADEWLQWQKEINIQQVLDTGLFYDHRIFKLLDQDETDGKTFVIQFFADNRKDYERYMQYHSADLLDKTKKKWGDQFITFRTLLQAVQ